MENKLPTALKPAQVRGALTAIIKKQWNIHQLLQKRDGYTIGLYEHSPILLILIIIPVASIYAQ
jgi:hypothetical protein